MKKKLSKISVLLVLMLTLAVCFAFGASAEETTYTEGNYTYTVTDGEATITDVSTWAISGTHITPTTLGGYPVTAIGEFAYQDCTSMTGLIVSEGVKTIDYGAFYGCDRLKSVVISEGVETIGSSAFGECKALESISLPDSLKSIGSTVFFLAKIKTITIPKNVSYIEPSAFLGAFAEKIIVDEENPYYSSDEYGVLFNKDKTTLVCWPNCCNEVNYTVPDTVKRIETGAFSYNQGIENVTLPEGLEEIGEYAFGISSIRGIHLPASVKTIEPGAFLFAINCETISVDENNPYFCAENGVVYSKDKTTLVAYNAGKKDAEFVIPETVTGICDVAFEGAVYLRKITVTNDFEIIQTDPEYASAVFNDDTIETLVFTKDVTNIPANTFEEGGFPKSIYIEGMNTELDTTNFNSYGSHLGGAGIERYTEEFVNLYKMVYTPEYVEKGEEANQRLNDLFKKEYITKDYLHVYCHEGSKAAETMATTDEKYTLTHFYDEESDWLYNSSNNVYGKVCLHCSNERLLFDFTVENNEAKITKVDPTISGDVTTPTVICGYPVTSIGSCAFDGCKDIKNLVISEGVTTIDGALMGNSCSTLENLTLPESLTTIGDNFLGYVKIDTLYLPKNVSTLSETSMLITYCNKVVVDEENPYFSSDEHGVLFNKDKTELIWYPFSNEATTYTVPDTVKTIGQCAFACGDNLEKVILPEGLETIDFGAFYLTYVKEVNIPSTVTNIHPSAFPWAFGLEKITVDENNPNYCAVDNVLFNKDKTTLITYPSGKAGRTYVIPESVTTTYDMAFYLNPNLESLTVSRDLEVFRGEDGVTPWTLDIGTGLTELVFKNDVQSLDSFNIKFGRGLDRICIENMDLELSQGFGKTQRVLRDISGSEYVANVLKVYRDVYGSEVPGSVDALDSVMHEYVYYYEIEQSYEDSISITCHENSKVHEFIESESGYGWSLTHFYPEDSEWVLDFENNTATRDCTACGTATEQICEYEVIDGEATIGRVYLELTGDVYLPETIDGYPLTGIDYLDYGGANLYLHKDIKNISDGAFSSCYANIHVDENNPYFIIEDGVLYDANKERLLKYPMYDERKYFETPETLVSIDGGAFFLAANLEKIKLNEGLKKIGEFAFAYICINGVELPSTLETIGSGAFALSPMIEKIVVPASVKTIDSEGLFTYFPLEVYFEGTDMTFVDWETFGIYDIEMNCTREELRDYFVYVLETFENGYMTEGEELEDMFGFLDEPIAHNKYYCHEGASVVDLMDAAADEYGVEDLYEYTHFFKNWTYDWEGLERTAKCLYCDETTTESLRSEEDNEIEFIAPADEETTFVVETVEDAESDDYILVTEALEAVEGPAEIEKIYDITLETSEGVAVQPDGSVQVKLPVEESHGNYKVFRVNDDGTYTDMNATVVDGYVVFVTDHFSLYVVVDTTEKTCEHEFDYTKSEANLKRPRQVDGTWVDGYYTYTCSLCGETETEVAKRADYTEYDVVETRFLGVLLNEDIDVNIRQKLLDELQATEVGFEENFIESEQQTLDRFTDYLLACTERAEVCVAGTHYFTKYEEVTAPKCGVAGLEKSVCDYCGAEDEKEIPALKHVPLAAVKEKEVAPTCEAAGSYDSVVYCDLCGEEISRETVTVSAKGHSKVTVPGKAATCKATGLTDGVKCSVCGKILTAQKTIAKADHKDKNGDYKCDYGCGHEFERPTPDKCDHMCHQSGFMGFIWKIVQFFWKLFKMNPVCECGAAHY